METQLSDETAKDIMDLIADPKLDVKKGVLGVMYLFIKLFSLVLLYFNN